MAWAAYLAAHRDAPPPPTIMPGLAASPGFAIGKPSCRKDCRIPVQLQVKAGGQTLSMQQL